MTVSIPPDLRPDPNTPLRIAGWEKVGTVAMKPRELTIDWKLSRPLTDFEVALLDSMVRGEDDFVPVEDREFVPALTTVDGIRAQVANFDVRLARIEQRGAALEERHNSSVSAALEVLNSMNWE